MYLKALDLSGNFVFETEKLATPSAQNPLETQQFEMVVIGSGFGGTILSTSLVNKFAKEDAALPADKKRKVCILERGQWWVSHEVPISAGGNELASKIKPKLGMREYLEANDVPYHLWAFPDNTNGLFAPTLPMAIALYLGRMALSQMHVPTRQSYIVAMVREEERVVAAGFTNISRNVSQAASPSLAGHILQALPSLSAPFVLGGALKIAYDVALYLNFRNTRPADEKRSKRKIPAAREPFYSPCNPSTRKVIN